MANKKEKNKTQNSIKGIRLAVFCIALVGVILFSTFYFFSGSGSTARPVFEEKYSIYTALEKEIRVFEKILYEELFNNGVPDENVLFMSVSPKYKNGNKWDFTEILIKWTENGGEAGLNNAIVEAVKGLEPDITLETSETAKDIQVFHIFIKEFYVYKIIVDWKIEKWLTNQTKPSVAIIIDDLGYDPFFIDAINSADFPLNLSILPETPYTEYIVRGAREKGFETLLHLPMEPKNFPLVNPGSGVLLTGMRDDEIRKLLNRNIDRVKGIKGINNHMGSLFTEKTEKMRVVLEELKSRGLYFIDSRTTAETVAYKMAKDMGIPAGERKVFLDNELNYSDMRLQMGRLIGIARDKGSAIGIAHPHERTLNFLQKNILSYKKKVNLVNVSEIIK